MSYCLASIWHAYYLFDAIITPSSEKCVVTSLPMGYSFVCVTVVPVLFNRYRRGSNYCISIDYFFYHHCWQRTRRSGTFSLCKLLLLAMSRDNFPDWFYWPVERDSSTDSFTGRSGDTFLDLFISKSLESFILTLSVTCWEIITTTSYWQVDRQWTNLWGTIVFIYLQYYWHVDKLFTLLVFVTYYKASLESA